MLLIYVVGFVKWAGLIEAEGIPAQTAIGCSHLDMPGVAGFHAWVAVSDALITDRFSKDTYTEMARWPAG